MLLKEKDFYINEKNIVTLQPYCVSFEYGLAINGVNYSFGNFYTSADEKERKAKFSQMKALCTKIIKAIEK